MEGWRETTLGEVCNEVDGIIQTGPFGSQLHESDYSPEGIPVVMPKDIVEGRISTDSVARVALEHVERLSRHKLQSGDIVYGRRGDIGRQALIRPTSAVHRRSRVNYKSSSYTTAKPPSTALAEQFNRPFRFRFEHHCEYP